MATIRKRSWRTASGEARESWQVDFVDQAGKRRHKQFSRKKDADAWLVEARGQVEHGTFSADSSSPTVARAAELWLERCERDGLERSTLTVYGSHLRHHIVPLLGKTKLSRLTRPRVEQFVDDLQVKGRSRVLTAKVLVSLKSIINEAMRRGLVAQNVATGVRCVVAARHRRKVAIPSKAEVKALLDGASPGRERAMLMTAVFTGLRASEIRALTWADVDFSAKAVRVRQRADTSGYIGALKTESSRRDVPMAPALATALKEWKLACPRTELGLVFPGRGGRPLCHNSLRDQLGRIHRFRHFFASWLIDQGFGPKRVQALLGHSSIKMTLDVYSHLWPQEDDHAKFAAAEIELVS